MTTANTAALNATLVSAKAAIDTLMGSETSRREAFNASSRKHAREVLAKLYQTGLVFLHPDNTVEFDALCITNGLDFRKGTSPWAKVVAIVMGMDNKTWMNRTPALEGLAFMKPDSADLVNWIDLFMIAKAKTQDGITDAQKTNISDLETAGIAGLQKLGEILRKKEGDPTRDDFLTAARDAEQLNLRAKLVKDAKVQYVMLWAVVDDGKVIPMGVVENSQAAAKAQALKAGVAIKGSEASNDTAVVEDEEQEQVAA